MSKTRIEPPPYCNTFVWCPKCGRVLPCRIEGNELPPVCDHDGDLYFGPRSHRHDLTVQVEVSRGRVQVKGTYPGMHSNE
jgi:hypothetical protein